MGLVIFGVDPGFASQGVAVLSQWTPKSVPETIFASSTKTEKRANKRKCDLRVSADDQRRYKELWESLEKANGEVVKRGWRVNAMCIEVYSPYKEATSAAAKCGAAYGGATYWGLGKGMVIIPAVPQDIKRGICGKLKASKMDVQKKIVELVPTMETWLAGVNKTQREHMSDAAAHAYVGLAEMWDLRKMLSTGSGDQMEAF